MKAATKGFSFFESAFAFTIKNLPRHFAKQGVGYDLCEQASHFNIYLSCSSRPLLAFNGPSLGTVKLRGDSLAALVRSLLVAEWGIVADFIRTPNGIPPFAASHKIARQSSDNTGRRR